jgi:hypothetical protein
MKRVLIAVALAGLAVAQPPAPSIGNCPVFPAGNIWNTRIDQLPVSPNSSTWVNTIGASAHLHPDFGSGLYHGEPSGIPYITVPGTQAKYPATFGSLGKSDPSPYAIPLNAPIEGGNSSAGDRHVISVDTGNCILYEIYDAFPQTAGWQGTSGAIFNLLSDALPPAPGTSADAAGLPIFPGLVKYAEIRAGKIDHAIRFTAPQTQDRYVWPARHGASTLTSTIYPPMGARFRLKASFDISSFSATNQIILTALKFYGMMLADNGSSWYISGAPDPGWNNDDLHVLNTIDGSSFEAVDVAPLMVNPNSGQALKASATSLTAKAAAIAIAILILLVAVVAVIGYMLPKNHLASRSSHFRQPPQAIWDVLAGPPEWRPDLRSWEKLAPRDGRRTWKEIDKHRHAITYESVEESPPHRLVTRIADPTLPFGGTWTFAIEPESTGCQVTITEAGEIYNPIFRFMARFVLGYSGTIETYLKALHGKFGETAEGS